MAATKSRTDDHQLQDKNKWKKDKDQASPERNKLRIQTTPKDSNSNPNPSTGETKVPVIYFLSRNGHLDQPHFMEVPLSSTHGLHLTDFTNRLNLLRGNGFASLYSWSFKRSYKNGFVWHDLADNELIHPSRGSEYILKGSELLDSTPTLPATPSFSPPKPPGRLQPPSTTGDPTPARNDSVSQTNSHQYKVIYKSKTDTDDGESTRIPNSNASTQTDERRTLITRKVEDQIEIEECQTTELTREDGTPPPLDSSPETLGTLILANRRLMMRSDCESKNTDVPRGRQRAASFLMHLVSCGPLSFKTGGLPSEGLSLVGSYKGRMVRRAGDYKPRTSREI